MLGDILSKNISPGTEDQFQLNLDIFPAVGMDAVTYSMPNLCQETSLWIFEKGAIILHLFPTITPKFIISEKGEFQSTQAYVAIASNPIIKWLRGFTNSFICINIIAFIFDHEIHSPNVTNMRRDLTLFHKMCEELPR